MKNKIYFLFFGFTFLSTALYTDDLTDYLVPNVKNLEQRKGTFSRNSARIIILEISDNTSLLRIVETLQSLLSQLKIERSVADRASENEVSLLWIYLTPVLPSQAYRITILLNQILLEDGDEASLFYAL